MSYDLSAESWGVVRGFLPPDWQASARTMGALTRARGVKNEETLLPLLLMHTAGGLSLKQTSMRAAELGLAKVSSVALFKRLRLAEPWLRHLSAQMAQSMAEYVLILTTLPKSGYPTKDILEIYRCRWQVELAFKRLKGLLEIGSVPKTDPDSSRAWMQGKVLAALLIDKILRQGRFFSPWGFVFE